MVVNADFETSKVNVELKSNCTDPESLFNQVSTNIHKKARPFLKTKSSTNNNHLSSMTNILNLFKIKISPMNSEHLSTMDPILGYKNWSFKQVWLYFYF